MYEFLGFYVHFLLPVCEKEAVGEKALCAEF